MRDGTTYFENYGGLYLDGLFLFVQRIQKLIEYLQSIIDYSLTTHLVCI
jgi:hypothetical protein